MLARLVWYELAATLAGVVDCYVIDGVAEGAVHLVGAEPVGRQARLDQKPVIIRLDAQQPFGDGVPVLGGGAGEPAVLAFSRTGGVLACNHLAVNVWLHLVEVLVLDV